MVERENATSFEVLGADGMEVAERITSAIDARLIAAAPELLTALIDARQYVAGEVPSEDGDAEELLSRIDAALKAVSP